MAGNSAYEELKKLANDIVSTGTVSKSSGATSANGSGSGAASAGKSQSTADYFSSRRKALGLDRIKVDLDYINSFISDSQKHMNSTTSDNVRMGFGTSSSIYESRKKEYEDLHKRSFEIGRYLEANKDELDESAYQSLKDYLDAFNKTSSQAIYAFYRNDQFISQFETEDDYLKWDAYSTPEKRKSTYEKNQTRLKELQEERSQLQQTQPGMNRYTYGGATNPGMPYGASQQGGIAPTSQQQTATDRRLNEIQKEIASIESEMRMYERGNTDESGFYYGNKVVDDYSDVMSDPSYGKFSGFRNYYNPTRETMQEYDALTDQSGWYRDGYGNLYDSRGVKIDETPDANGIIQSPLASDSRYTVTDPLGLYLSTSEDERNEAVSLADGVDGSWEALVRDGYFGNWEQLTEGEIGIYYTLLGTKGKDAAMQYLTDMTTELNRRNMISDTERYNQEFAEASTLERIAMSLATTPAQLLGGATAFLDDVSHTIRGEDINPYSAAHELSNYAQTTRGNQAAAWDEATKGAKIPFINFTVGDLYQAGMSAVDMGVGSLLGGGAYEVLMGMGSASSEAKRLYEQGASKEQVAWGGALAGAAEMVFEHASIENLINLKYADTLGQFVKNLLIQGGIEASEEGFTDIANTITNAIVMGSESDWAKLVEKHGGDRLAAFIEKVQEVGSSAFAGFVSGGIGGSGSSAIRYAVNQAQNAQTGKIISGANSTDALRSLALEMAKGASKGDQKRLTYQSNNLGNDFLTKTGKNIATGRLYNTVRSVVTEQNISEISTALQENGISKKDATAIAGAVAVQANGMELTKDQQKVLDKFKNNENVQNVVNEILDNNESGINQRARSVAKFEFDTMRNDIISRMKQEAPGQENTSASDTVDANEESSSETSYEVSADGKTILKSTGEIVSIKNVAAIKDGKVTLNLEDGRSVNAADVSFSSNSEAIFYDTVAQMDASVKAANILVNSFNALQGDSVQAEVFARGVSEAFRYGKLGLPSAALTRSKFAKDLTVAQQDYVYRQGKKVAGKQVAQQQAVVSSVFNEAKATAKSGTYQAVLEDGITALSLNESQKASYRLADNIAQAAKVNIHVYLGKTAGERGYYNPSTDEIWLNLNATNQSRQSMMAFALGHELVHRAKKGSPGKYQAFTEFLMKEYGKSGASVEAMIQEELDAAKEFGIKMTEEQAFEEVVCNACERMLLDTDAGKRLAEFGAQSKENKSFLEDLKRWISEFLDKLRSIFQDVDPSSLAAKEFAKFDANAKKILADMYVDMTIDAGEKLSTIQNAFGKGTVVEANEQGEFTMARSADGSKVLNNLTTWNNGGRETLEATLLREGYTEDEVKAALTIMDEKQKLVESIANEVNDNGKVPTEYSSLREYLYAIGGARMQSFSDFIIENWFDYCQIVADLAARKLPMHTYTKEIALARLFGLTGIKINMSLIPDVDRSLGKEYAGLTRNANGELELIWADKDRFKATGGKSYMQSINFADAIALQEDPRYSANVGTIAVGISDRHIRMMLADPRIRMVIPYHSSGMNPIFADLMGTSYYKDYTLFQNTTIKQIYNSKGQPVSLSLSKTQEGKLTGGFLFNSVLQELGDARAAAEAYKEWCADASKHTITIKGETYTAELTPKFNDFSGEENYYKLLEDFNTYDCITEEAAPQGDVQQNYPEGFEDILRAELSAQEGHRQKQEANKSFDKAMDEIEGYLKNHTKADTVHYANQHGIKLGAKDKKLSAEDKARLKELQKQGVSFMLPKKITMSMTDSERTEILKDKVITAEVYEGQAENSIAREKDSLESTQIGMVKAALERIANEFGVFVDYKIEDVEVKLSFSKTNLEESVSKKINPNAVAKLMPVLKTAVENAIGIESHANRYYYDTDIVRFENLVGGYVEGDSFVPVRFGLKHRLNGEVILYVIVDQQKIDMDKIKAEVVKITGQDKLGQETSRSAYKFSIQSIAPFVNGEDLLRYLPDDMLNASQKEVKWKAIADTIKRTNDKNDRKYAKYIREGKLRVAKQMVQQAAKMNGYIVKAFHQTNAVFNEFSTDNPVAGKYDSETPNGIFFKTNDHDIGLGGGIQMEVYLNIQNMLHFKNREEANAWYCDNVPGYNKLQDQMNSEIKVINDEIESMDDEFWSEDTSEERYEELSAIEDQLIAKMEVIENDYRGRLRGLLNDYFLSGKSGYDGIELEYDGHRWVNGKREDVHTYIAFDPKQAKSSDAITYDDNGDIIPISQRFNAEKKDIRYNLPVGEDTSPRALLSNALEAVTTNPIEKQKLQEYKEKVEMLNAEEQKLNDLRKQIKKLSFSKGHYDADKVRELQFEANMTANRINTFDKQLLRLEASKPLQNVLTREKKMAYDRGVQRGKEALDAYRERAEKQQQEIVERYQESRKRGVENRHKTIMRQKLRKVILDLDKILNRGDKKRNVKEDMKGFVAEALYAAEILFMDSYTNEDMVRNGVGTDLTPEEAKFMNEARSIMDEISNLPSGSYDAMIERQEQEQKLKGRLAYRMARLKGVFIRERARINKTQVSEVLGNLADAYGRLQNSEYDHVQGAYHENVHEYLKMLQEDVGGTIVKDMTLNQLEELYKAFTMVKTTVYNANRMFAENLNNTRDALANRVMVEVHEAGGEHGLWTKAGDRLNSFSWNNEKPVYAFERIGSKTLKTLYGNIRKGQDTWAVDLQEANDFRKALYEKYGHNTWDTLKTYKFTASSGIDFELNLDQIMSLYAYSKRAQAHDHLLKGGFVFDGNTEVLVNKRGLKIPYLNKDATAYNLSFEILEDIISKLTDDQKAFADEMQEYLSSTMGEKGNEVSMQLYGVKLFNEKFYFPLRSAGQYMERAKEADMKKEQGQINIANSGFSKATKIKASNPVVLSGFMDVWASHVNEMSMYHSFVLPMEDFRRVYNYSSPHMEGQQSASVNGVIQNAYGAAATDYIDKLYRDLNGGAIADKETKIILALMNRFKKGAVFASASVTVQQPSAIARATAMVDIKHFIGPKVDAKRHKALWEEVKQYAPVAIIKEMGFFDTNMGRSAKDFLTAEEYSGIKEKALALVKDESFRDELLSKAPALADELTWCVIWEAVKRETKAKHPGMDVKSEEFLKIAGERFSEVIDKTQVYDSVLARSANMRSKDTGMKMATAFMAEPTTSINMVADALRKGKKGNKKQAARIIGSVVGSVILNSFLVAWVYAARDDDEDETFREKYISSFLSGIIDGVNPMTYIPFLKDIVSITQGYDVERSDMAVISDLWNAYKQLKKDNVSAWRKVEGFAGSICQIFGLPVKNIMRDLRSVYQAYNTIVNGEENTARGTAYAIMEGITGQKPSKSDQLYNSRISGDTKHAARVEARYDDEKSANAAVRKEITDRYMDGELTLAQATMQLTQYAGMEMDDAYWLMDSWKHKKETGSDEDYSKYNDFYEAVQTGKNLKAVIQEYTANGVNNKTLQSQITEHFKPEYVEMSAGERAKIKGYLINAYEQCGISREKAEERLRDWDFEAKNGFAYDDRKAAYMNGEISDTQLRTALIEYGGYSDEDADYQIKAYDWEKQGYEGVTVAAVKAYLQPIEGLGYSLEDAGIPRDLYLEYRKRAAECTGVDANGDGKADSNSIKNQKMDVIDSMNLTSEQKDAMYFANGWAKGKLKNAPWH